MATQVKPYQDISLPEGIQLIARLGHLVAVMARGPMGMGKSTMLKELAKLFPNHIPCYVDMTTKDVGDLLMPRFRTLGTDGTPDPEGMDVCEFIPNSEFGFQYRKDLIIMWDEFTKANKTIQTQCIRALQERQLGMHKFSEKTIQFATGNTSEEGLQDGLMPHHQNRMLQITLRQPGPKEWTEDFALDHKVHPTVIQAVNEFPQMLMSYKEFKAGDNPYVYDPRKPMPAFTTGRSLEKFSDMLYATEGLPYDVQVHAGGGLVGERAAMDIMSVHQIYGQLPDWEKEVLKKPETARIPESAGAVCLFIYAAIQRVEKDTIGKLMIYLQRLPKEAQALFASTAINTSKAGIVTGDKKFYEWAESNHWLYSKQ